MPEQITVTLGDDGTIVGETPTPLKALLDKTFDAGFGKAYKRAADEAKQQMGDPLDREKLRQLEERERKREIEEAEREKRYQDAQALRDKDWQGKVAEREAALAKHQAVLSEGLKAEIRAAALKAGARDESLEELADLLISRFGRDADLRPFVKATDGSAATGKDGKALTLDQAVTAYLDDHQHHRKVAAGKGGGATGGASTAGAGTDAQARFDEARKNYRLHSSDPKAQREYLEAEKALKAQKTG